MVSRSNKRQSQTIKGLKIKKLVTVLGHKLSDDIASGTLNSILKQTQIKL